MSGRAQREGAVRAKRRKKAGTGRARAAAVASLRAAVVGGALALAGCIFAEAAVQTRSVRPEKPRPDPVATPGGETAAREEVVAPAEDPLPEPAYVPQPTRSMDLGGGVVALARDWSMRADWPDRTALLRVTLPVGAATGAPGLAELTAAVVAEGAGSQDGAPSMRARIERLGGELLFRIDAHATSFAATVPRDQWPAAVEAMVDAVRQRPDIGESVERIRHGLARRLRGDYVPETLDNLVRVVTRAARITPGRYLAGIEDRTQPELAAYHEEHYRPAGSVLTLWVPGIPADSVLEAARRAVEPWTAAETVSGTRTAGPDDALDPGVYWAPSSTEQCAFAVVFPTPTSTEPASVGAAALLECMTLDGIGGRLEQAMAASALALQSGSYWNGAAHHLALNGVAAPGDVLALWQAQREARRSLARHPPERDELRLAAQRLRLRWIARYSDPLQWLEWATSLGLRGVEPPDLAAVLEQLDSLEDLDGEAAAEAFAALEPSLVVVGPLPDEASRPADVELDAIADAFAVPGERSVPLDANDQAVAADEHLERALRAAGGVQLLSGLSGWTEERLRRSPLGATIEESIWYRAPDRYRRVRRVLATTIETVLGPAASFDRAGGQTVELDEDERRMLLLRVQQHPISLLAAYARGQNRFRLVSVRSEGDREMVVLQLLDDSYDRLRMTLDAESGLVRAVERYEWRSERTSRVRITERYGDYRTVNGIRFPFFSTTTVEDGQDGGSTVWRHVELVPPAPTLLEPTGT